MSVKPGSTLGQYQILGELGRGGMAIVYRAYQPALNRTVAIKVLPPQLALDASFVQRFMLEARNAARLDHPNIVTIHDVGQADGVYFIVMQEAQGEPLNSLIQREGRLTPDRALAILTQVAAALDYAHAQGLVHRDIKPGNVIVGPGDKAVLTDFGIARAVEGARLTQTGAIMGTPEYMSPEQAKGEAVGPATDIYSLGIILYEMMAGKTPFKADSTPAVLYKQVHEQAAPVRSVARDLPPAIDGVLARALAKSPGQRFRTAGAMAQALRDAITAKVETGPASQRRTIALLAALGAIAIVAVALIALLAGGDGVDPAATPPAQAEPPSAATKGVAPPAPAASPAATRTARALIGQAINAYAGPGRDYSRMGEFAAGDAKDIVGRDASRGWWLVCCLSGEPVWIDANLARAEGDWSSAPLATVPSPTATTANAAPLPTETLPPTPTPLPQPTATPAIPVLTITDGAVRLRQGPGVNYGQLGEADESQQFEIIGRSSAGDWWQIRFQGQTAWVSGQFALPAGNLAAIPVVQAPPPPVVCSQPAAGEFAGIWTSQVKERIGCPLGPASVTDAAFEPFERGRMIWRKDALSHYVIADDGGWRSYADVWIEGLPDFSCPAIAPSASPPTPLRGFGQIWCQNDDVRQRLGNALDREWAERMTVQAFERGMMILTGQGAYVLFADGGWTRR